MAWYALYKWFAPWRKTPYVNQIFYYSEYVRKSEKQRMLEKEARRRKAISVMAAFNALSAISTR